MLREDQQTVHRNPVSRQEARVTLVTFFPVAGYYAQSDDGQRTPRKEES